MAGEVQVVAVKQLNQEGLQGNQEFIVEVLMLSLLHHKNLVNLIGYCTHHHQRLLVYEFMPNGSLENHLFGNMHIYIHPSFFNLQSIIQYNTIHTIIIPRPGPSPRTYIQSNLIDSISISISLRLGTREGGAELVHAAKDRGGCGSRIRVSALYSQSAGDIPRLEIFQHIVGPGVQPEAVRFRPCQIRACRRQHACFHASYGNLWLLRTGVRHERKADVEIRHLQLRRRSVGAHHRPSRL